MPQRQTQNRCMRVFYHHVLHSKEYFMSITTQVIILFIVVLIGVGCRKLGYFTDETIRGVTQLVINITVPALTISNMQRPFDMSVLKGFALTMLLTFMIIVVAVCAGLLLFRNREHAKKAVLVNLIAFPNCGFMGYPIILAVNPDWMIYAVAYNITCVFTTWTIGVSLFKGKENISLRRVLLNPNILSAVVGFFFFCTSTALPAIPAEVLSMVGGLTTPLTMLLLGTRLCGLRLRDLTDMDYHIAAAISLVILPLLAHFSMRALPIAPAVAGTVFLLTAMPCGTLTAMQAELYDGDKVFAARAIAYATLLALVSVPLLSALL